MATRPSRTLIQIVDDGILDGVLETKGSDKIGKYVPGTMIPALKESRLLLSWHIAAELIPKLPGRGFWGRFIVPLPHPRIVESA